MPLPSHEVGSLLADLKDHLNITRANHDGELLGKVEAAFDLAEAIVGHALYPGTYTETTGEGVTVLSRGPVTGITAATYYDVSYLGRVMWTPSGIVTGVFPNTSITYTYGQTAPTALQREAILKIAGKLWESQRGQATGPLQSPDDIRPDLGYGRLITSDIESMLNPPIGRPVIA